MPMLEKTLAPPHPIVFIYDPTHDHELPPFVEEAIATATSSCVYCKTKAYVDGETSFRLGDRIENPIGDIVFDGVIETPGRRLEVLDSHEDVILSMDVPNQKTHLTIWTSHPEWPDFIQIQAR